MRILPLMSALAGAAAAATLPFTAAAEAPAGAKPRVEAPARPREVPARPEARKPDGGAPRVMEDEGVVPDWRGCPYFERKLELIV